MTLVVLTQSPAQADGELSIMFNPGSVQVNIGGGAAPATMTLQATRAVAALDVTVTGSVNGLNNQAGVDMGGGNCTGGGNQMQCRIEPGGTAVIQLSVAPRPESNLPEGEPLQGSYDVTASARDASGGGGNSGGSLPITVIGAANADAVPSITGTISGDGNKPLEGVKIEATDSAGATFNATTGSDGTYSITPGGGTIEPGEITLKATKSGYETKTVKVNGIGGEAAKSTFTMVKKTDKPDDSGSAEAPPVDNGTAAEEKDDGWSTGTWILAIVGVLFVVGGIVAIVLLLKRGKHDEEDDDLFADKPPVHTPKAAQTGLPGVYDAGPRSPVMDAPTMIHNGPLLDDEDLARYGSGGGPSAAPPTTAFGPAYGDRGEQPTQMFDPRAAGPVSGAPMSGGPVSGGPVSGGPVSGAPTQMFDPRGYDDRDSYGSPPPSPSRGGYDERDRGYGPPADRGYGPPSQDQRGGYGDQGYGAPAPD
ncbi:MAG TPA: carboxypeptidase-like regulatory domain-containing protein, partial [Phytomonospora sp.]